VAIVASFLPFFTVGVTGLLTVDVGMKGAFRVIVFLLVAAVVACLLPLIQGSALPNNRLIGVTVAVALLIGLFFLVLAVNSNPDDVAGVADVNVSWAFGLYLFALGIIAMIVGVVMLWMQRGKAPRV
jgi:heme O synthase-like polyprenyltransferase